MPFQSKAQRRWMYANDPKLAKKFEAHTLKEKRLPEHVNDKAGDRIRKLKAK